MNHVSIEILCTMTKMIIDNKSGGIDTLPEIVNCLLISCYQNIKILGQSLV